MSELAALGPSGGARGVDQRGRVLGTQRRTPGGQLIRVDRRARLDKLVKRLGTLTVNVQHPAQGGQLAGELGLLKVPVFMFQEGHDATAEQAFREIARLTGGAWCKFDPGAAAQLRELLRAAAAYATGGREALKRLSASESGAAKLLGQMK